MLARGVACLCLAVGARGLSALAAKADSYKTSSPLARRLVGSLTSVVNTFAGSSAAPVEERLRKAAKLTPLELLNGLKSDFVDAEYLWSGKINAELYSEGCVFTDPTLSFVGLSTFETNLRNLDPILERFAPPSQRRVSLVDLRLDEEQRSVVARWRMLGDIKLPWNPSLILEGRTTFSYGADGRIEQYDEEWLNLSAVEALVSLLKPAKSVSKKPRPLKALIASPIIVLPGFGNNALDYIAPLGAMDGGLVGALERRGAKDVSVLEIERKDWIKVFSKGLLNPGFWKGTADCDSPSYAWYTDRAKLLIEEKCAGGAKAVLVGHSAGGWLARALLRRFGDVWAAQHISLVITLGAPHSPPEDVAQCATRGVLAELQRLDALLAPLTPVLTVAGDVVVDPALTSDSYDRVRGAGAGRRLAGDGVVPLVSAHLGYAVRRRISLESRTVELFGKRPLKGNPKRVL